MVSQVRADRNLARHASTAAHRETAADLFVPEPAARTAAEVPPERTVVDADTTVPDVAGLTAWTRTPPVAVVGDGGSPLAAVRRDALPDRPVG